MKNEKARRLLAMSLTTVFLLGATSTYASDSQPDVKQRPNTSLKQSIQKPALSYSWNDKQKKDT